MGRGPGREPRGERLMPARRSRASLLAGLALVVPTMATAGEPTETLDVETELDSELLEFLGTIDDGEQEWTDYLAQTDIAKVAKAKQAPAPKDDAND